MRLISEIHLQFLYHLKQHYSQTPLRHRLHEQEFLYHLKQHYSQTSNLPKSAKMGNKIDKIGCFAILSERLRHYMRRCFR